MTYIQILEVKRNKMGRNVVFLRSTSIKNDSRITKEVECLKRNGYEVTIFGWDRDGFLGEEKTLELNELSIPVKAFRKKAKYGAGIKSLFKLLQFQVWLTYKLIKIRKNIDIIHACDLDTALPAKFISKIFKKKMVYDIFDYYIDSHHVPKIMESKIENMEIKVINNADITIICTEQRKEQIKKANPKKCIVIYNTPKIDEEKIQQKIIKASNEKFKIVYVGILQNNRLLKEIGEEIKKYENIELHIGGFGKLEEYFLDLSEKYNNIFYYGKMKYEDVLRLEKDADVLFATYNPKVQNHKYSAPNKLYEAMALGKPIIVCKNTGIDKIVDKEKIGCRISYNVKEFIEAVEKLSNDKLLLENIKNKTKKIYNDKYSWRMMEKRLIEEYKKL